MDTTSVEQIADRCEEELSRLRAARPALSSRISRAENILVTHLSCRRARMIRARVCSGELVSYLVKGSGGAVYVVDPQSWQCSCPDAHRRGKGCKHSLVCWALMRASARPASARNGGRRCDTRPKTTRRDVANGLLRELEGASDFEHVGEITPRVLAGVASEATASERAGSSYEERTCSRCQAKPGLTYDEQRGEWVACERCSGTGRALVFVYPKAGSAGRLLAECAGCGRRFRRRELIEVTEDHESLTWFTGDKLCRRECAGAHGVLWSLLLMPNKARGPPASLPPIHRPICC